MSILDIPWLIPLGQDIAKKVLGVIQSKATNGETLTRDDLDNFMLFSPFAMDDVDQELVVFGAAAIGLYLSKTERGMKLLETMVKKYFETITSLTSSMAKGGSTHVISSLTSQMITIRMMRRLGLISQQEANAIHSSLIDIANKVLAPAIIESITGVGTMVFGELSKALTVR